MTTATSSSRIRHDSNATFREWIQEMEGKLAACGLVQTSDTGQINTSTATLPATNTSAGYQIWRFNDSLQGTFPIFLRIEYRTGAVANAPGIFIGVGTGTNGSGTLTGGASYTPEAIHVSVAQTTDTARNSFWCHTESSFGMDWKQVTGTTESVFMIARTVDSTGAATGLGCIVASMRQSSNSCRYLLFAGGGSVSAPATTAAQFNACHLPWSVATTLVSGVPQVGICWVPTPGMKPVLGMVGVLNTEFTTGVSFPFTAAGSTSHTYLAASNFAFMDAGSNLKPAFLWE